MVSCIPLNKYVEGFSSIIRALCSKHVQQKSWPSASFLNEKSLRELGTKLLHSPDLSPTISQICLLSPPIMSFVTPLTSY